MDAAVFGMDHFGQDVQIGVLQFGSMPEIQHHVGDRNALEGFQHVHVGGVAGLGLFDPCPGDLLDLHFLEEDLSQLQGRADGEFFARFLEYLFGELFQLHARLVG